jgi:hypothetical protein
MYSQYDTGCPVQRGTDLPLLAKKTNVSQLYFLADTEVVYIVVDSIRPDPWDYVLVLSRLRRQGIPLLDY